jgi:hypothetical protein
LRAAGLIAFVLLLAGSSARAGTLDEPSPLVLRHMALLDPNPNPAPDGWNPGAVRQLLTEKVISIFPGGFLEGVARSFADQTLQLELGPDRAFFRLRLVL